MMRVEIVHPETGERFNVDIPTISAEDLERMAKEHTKDNDLKARIDNLPIAAEAKAIIFKLVKFTIKVGETAIRIGKQLLEIAIMLATKYTHATFGVILGALITSLIAAIPILGPALASFLGPLLMIFGLSKGIWEDLKHDSPQLATSIMSASSVYRPLGKMQVA